MKQKFRAIKFFRIIYFLKIYDIPPFHAPLAYHKHTTDPIPMISHNAMMTTDIVPMKISFNFINP